MTLRAPIVAHRHVVASEAPLWVGRGIAADTIVATSVGGIAAGQLHPGTQLTGPGGAILEVTHVRRVTLVPTACRRLGVPSPVRIPKGALGFGIPVHPLTVGPAQRLRLAGGWVDAALLAQYGAIRHVEQDMPMVVLHHRGDGPFLAAGVPVDGGEGEGRDIAATIALLLRLSKPSSARIQEIDGHVDRMDRNGMAGWAMDRATPDRVLPLEIVVEGRIVAHAVTCLPRSDVAPSGHAGRGLHGFAVRYPSPLPADRSLMVEVRLAGGGPRLPSTPVLLDRAACLPNRFDLAVAAAGGDEATATYLGALVATGIGWRQR